MPTPRAHVIAQDIPKLVFRASGELHIAFSTGHVQNIWLRGEVSTTPTRYTASDAALPVCPNSDSERGKAQAFRA